MNVFLSIPVLLFCLAAFCTCSSGGNDPLGTQDNGTGDFGGQLTQGGNGANKIVTDSYKLALSQYVINQTFQAYRKSISVLANLPSSGDSLRSVRLTGNYFGYAIAVLNSAPPGSASSMDFNETLTFYNYSDSGSIYTGGVVDCIGTAEKNSSGIWSPKSLYLNRGMFFAGAYSGSVTFDRQEVVLDIMGFPFSVYATALDMCYRTTSGSLTIKSGSHSIVFNPYYRLVLPADTVDKVPCTR